MRLGKLDTSDIRKTRQINKSDIRQSIIKIQNTQRQLSGIQLWPCNDSDILHRETRYLNRCETANFGVIKLVENEICVQKSKFS